MDEITVDNIADMQENECDNEQSDSDTSSDSPSDIEDATNTNKSQIENFLESQDYNKLFADCVEKGVLFEDDSFVADNELLTDSSKDNIISYMGANKKTEHQIQWLRPHEICEIGGYPPPQMIVEQRNRFDINQGELGDCWFLSALANIAENDEYFNKVVVPGQTFSSPQYAGIFRFRFYRSGAWVEVVIDDKLPTRNNRLIYLRAKDDNEFWSPLFEKAYAKLKGSYRALEGGLAIEASIDFTGGIPEVIIIDAKDEDSKIAAETVFSRLSQAHSQNAFMATSLTRDSQNQRDAVEKGLVRNHYYTITKVLTLKCDGLNWSIPLIRLRNPHGNHSEWRGDWADNDHLWNCLSTKQQQELGLDFNDDGEFYMNFNRDFMHFFGKVDITHLAPSGVGAVKDGVKQFDVFRFEGEWSNLLKTAGGCGNDGIWENFASNPHFIFTLTDSDPSDDKDTCPVIISLSQVLKERKTETSIGFKLYKCPPNNGEINTSYISRTKPFGGSDQYVNQRDLSKRFSLPVGSYFIIPSTFNTGVEGKFMLRVFVEKYWGSSEEAKKETFNELRRGSWFMLQENFTSRKKQEWCLDPESELKLLQKMLQNKTLDEQKDEGKKKKLPVENIDYSTIKNFVKKQNYDELIKECREQGKLFEDPEFKASNSVLTDYSVQNIIAFMGIARRTNSKIEWLRPREICSRAGHLAPEFQGVDRDRFDINQGEIQNSWLMSALANLAENKEYFRKVVPEGQSFCDEDYAGIFRFRFYRFGHWEEVVVDDRLPTRDNCLVYLRPKDPNEFWSPLLEKAYAKLCGSYKALEKGEAWEAAIDLTGGIPEIIELDKLEMTHQQLFYNLYKSNKRKAFMSCMLTTNPTYRNEAVSKGLVGSQQFSVTSVIDLRFNTFNLSFPLIRLRNPYGAGTEWNGDWSDNEEHWNYIPKAKKEELGVDFGSDGEFYMNFNRDFVKYFDTIEIVHLKPHQVGRFSRLESSIDLETNFESFYFSGAWDRKLKTAGGCGNGNNFKKLASNPHFNFCLTDPDPTDEEMNCPVIVSLSQKSKKRKPDWAIGFKIYSSPPGNGKIDASYLSYTSPCAVSGNYTNLREVSKRFELPMGSYFVLPTTFNPGEEAEFLLRVFIEKSWGASDEGSKIEAVEAPEVAKKSHWQKVKAHFMKRNQKCRYNWTMDPQAEIGLLKKLIKSQGEE